MPALLLNQLDQLKNPDARVVLARLSEGERLSRVVDAAEGLSTGDNARFVRGFWEVGLRCPSWVRYAGADVTNQLYGGRELLVRWDDGSGPLATSPQARIQGVSMWERTGVLVGRIRGISASAYTGGAFDKSCLAVCPKGSNVPVAALLCYLSSHEYRVDVRRLDQKLGAAASALLSVAYAEGHWQKVAEEQYPNGLPEPYSDDPTQWLFHGHPSGSVVWDEQAKWTRHGPPRTDSTVLQVAVARLLGYRWPAEQDAEMRLADEQRHWVEKAAELHEFEDPDGVVCVPAVLKERSAADRLRDVLAASFPGKWSLSLEESLLEAAGYRGRGVEAWLRDGFFQQHCQLFHHRPFIWHIWDGRRDGFSALVNYHWLDRAKLDKLTYSYLGDWISRQKQAAQAGTPGAEGRLGAAQDLQAKLKLISDGEAPCDIYVRWKALAEQPIGWEPDLNDGVRLNIRPFVTAGVLRWNPNIKWNKDRGKDPDGSERINDRHLTLEEKRGARGS